MNEVATNGDGRMTVKQVADALGVDPRTVRRHIADIRQDLDNVVRVETGKTTYISEAEATEIKRRIERSGRTDLPSVTAAAEITTDLEMRKKTVEVMTWLVGQVQEAERKLAESERRNAVLMHVAKTYTATEIAKELNMKSAQELNRKLVDMGIQYKQNETWVLKSDYSDMGYTDIKQTVLDNGRVVYDRHFTQDGRAFILGLFE